MVHASTDNERNVDRVAEAVISQHPRIHLRGGSETREGKRQRQDQTWKLFEHLLVSGRVNTLAVENLEQALITRTLLPVTITAMTTTRSD